MFQNVILGWVGRRALEVGGLIGTLWSAYSVLPPDRQEIVNRILSGEWQDITLGAIVPFLIYLGSQVMSFRATVQPAVVTESGTKMALPDLDASTRAKVKVDIAGKKIEARSVPKPRFNPLDWFLKRG